MFKHLPWALCVPHYSNTYVGFFEKALVFNLDKNSHFDKILKRYCYTDIF